MSFTQWWARALVLGVLVMALPASAQLEEQAGDVRQQAEQFDRDLASLRGLTERIDTAPEQDRDALVFRRDERSLQLLVQLDQLARDTVQLPDGDPVRAEIQGRIERGLQEAGTSVLQRITELGARIASLQGERDAAGGVQLVLTTAVEGMEPERLERHSNSGCLFIAPL